MSKPSLTSPKAILVTAFLILVLLLLILFAVSFSFNRVGDTRPIEAEGGGERRVILLLVDRLTIDVLQAGAGPALTSLLTEGAVSLMNVRSGRAGSESGYLSLGSGARAAAGSEGNLAFQRGESFDGFPAEELYQRHNGTKVEGDIFHLHPLLLQERNNTLDYPVAVGNLGRLLEEGGLTAAVVGSTDGAGPGRAAVMVAMNPAGLVPLGVVGSEVVVEDSRFPYGKHTDPDKLLSVVAELVGVAHLTVVDFGDLARLDQYWPQLPAAVRSSLLTETMARLDRVTAGLLELAEDSVALMLAAPSPPVNIPGTGELMLPFALYTVGGSGPGLLISPTTRRPGLISNTDLTPMVYGYLTAGSPVTWGDLPVEIIPRGEPAAFLADFAYQASVVFSLRPPIIRGFITALVLALLTALAAILLRWSHIRRLFFVFDALMLVPLTLLLLPGLSGLHRPSPYQTGAILVAGALLLLLALSPLNRKGRLAYWAAVGLLTCTALIIDTLLGSPLQQASILGYDPIAGARYYGVGNEYMGALIGSVLLGTFALTGAVTAGDRPHSHVGKILYGAIFLLYMLIIAILASPGLGTNFGGTISAALAFGAAWAGLTGSLEQWRSLALSILLFLAAAIGFLWSFNVILQPAQPSHLGQFGEMVGQRGFAGFKETVLRKISMNWRLVRYSLWSRAFAALLGLLVIISFYPVGLIRRIKEEQPYLVKGAVAGLTGSVAALLANDSGIVAAATVLLFTVPPVLMVIMSKVVEEKSSMQENDTV